MAARNRNIPQATQSDVGPAIPQCRTGFALFLLLTATLFVRPAEIIAGIEGWPIYEAMILICICAAFPAVIHNLKWRSLASQPAQLYVACLLPAILLSHLSHGNTWAARLNGLDFLKVLIYYILLVSLLTTRRRLETFMAILLVLVAIMAVLSLLTYYGILDIEALSSIGQYMGMDASGNDIVVPRLCGAGIFHDPNDFSLMLVTTILIAVQLFLVSRAFHVRLLLVASLAPIGCAFYLTYSRGGFLSLLGASATFLIARYPIKRASMVAMFLMPLVFVVFAGRQTNINLASDNDTAQGRMHLWRDSLVLFHGAPIFGIGNGMLADEIGLVAHNSYVQAFAELGLFGGIAFIGAFLVPLLDLGRLIAYDRRNSSRRPDSWIGCVLAIIVGYAVGLLSLTRNTEVSTYVILGLAGAFVAVTARRYPQGVLLRGAALVKRVLVVGIVALGTLELVARFLVN